METRALLAWSRAAATTAPVFIVGVSRSGTSILYRSLQLQAPFALGPGRRGGEGEVDLTETRMLRSPRALLGIGRGAGRSRWPWRRDLPGPHALRQFLLFDADAIARVHAATRAVPRWRRLLLAQAEYPPHRPRGPAALRLWQTGWGHHLVRVYFDAARAARGVERLVEKTPPHADALPEIRIAFPHARILFCVRHPVTTRASTLRRRRRREALGFRFAPGSIYRHTPEEFIALYRRTVGHGFREQALRPDGIHWVVYEDLVRDPEQTLERVADLLDEDFDSLRLPEETGSTWRAEDDPRLAAPIVADTEDWQEFVRVDEARALEKALAPEMRALGQTSLIDAGQ